MIKNILGRMISCIGLFGVCAVLTFFVACTVGPDYIKPTIETPSSYKEAEEWKIAQPRDHIVRGAWWKIFGDPQLDALEEQVNVSNQNVAVAEANFRQARALVRAARAGYFPTLTAGASYSRSLRPSTTTGAGASGSSGSPGKTGGTASPDPTGNSGGTGSTGSTGGKSPSAVSDFLLPVDFSWELDVWGRVRRSVESSSASAQASAADLEAVRLSSQAELAQDYFQLRAVDAQKRLLEDTVTAFQRTLDLTRNRYTNGIASKLDVLQAETQLKTTEAQLIDLNVQRAQLEHAIAVLIGKPASVFAIPASPLNMVPPPIPVGVPSELLERRPDIASAERHIASANAQIGVAKSAFYPTVTLSASGGYESSKLSKWLTWPNHFWSVGTAIAESVFEGGLRRAQTTQAQAAYDASVAFYRQTVLTAFQEVEDNLAALRILEQEAQAQDEAVKASRQSVQLTVNQYKAGTVSYLNILVSQTVQLDNERTAVDIMSRRMAAGVLLIKALGGGWNVSGIDATDVTNSVETGMVR